MPIILEIISKADGNDLVDLLKIYRDSPRFNTLSEAAADSAIQQWIGERLGDKHNLLAGRFNDRLVTAMWATVDRSGDWQLDALCVRKVTRRRGVARQLLAELIAMADHAGIVLTANNDELPLYLHRLLGDTGFTLNGTQWRRQPRR